MEKKSIIKQSSSIREALTKRIEELGLTRGQLQQEAERFGVTGLTTSTMSRYFKGIFRGSLTEEAIIFLCFRFGIPITINVGIPVFDKDKKLKHKIPPYNEQHCIDMVNKFFKEVADEKG